MTRTDIVKLIDKTGSTVVSYTYDTWGKLLSTTGSLAATFGAEQPFRYRGYVYDEETGFYYLQSRYYNPEVGRFISADVYLSTGQGVLGHNSYAYCLNNPVNMKDYSGRIPGRFCYVLQMYEGGGTSCSTYGGGAVTITVTSNKIQISANIIVSGTSKYDERFVENSLKKYYEGIYTNEGSQYSVELDLNFMPDNVCYGSISNAIKINIIDGPGTSFAHGYYLENRWCYDKSGEIFAYTRWNDGSLKLDFDWTLAHEFTHCLNIGDQGYGEECLFGGYKTIMNTRGVRMTNGVMQLILIAFRTNTGQGW